MYQGGGVGALGFTSFVGGDFVGVTMVAPGASCHTLFVLLLLSERVEYNPVMTSRRVSTLYAL